MKGLFQLEIPRRATTCFKGNEALLPGMDYYSVLTPAALASSAQASKEEKKIYRQDFCPLCWEQSAKEETIQQQKSYWKSKVSAKKEEKQLALSRDERALELLKASLHQSYEGVEAECFVLALYLARRKIVALRQELKQENGENIQLYEIHATEEILCVKKIDLSQFSIQNIQIILAEKLKNG